MQIFQVTIPASGKANIATFAPVTFTGALVNVYVQELIIQNNANHSIRVGDSTVTSSRGILLASGTPGGSLNENAFMNYGTYLSDWWIVGTIGDIIDILYIP